MTHEHAESNSWDWEGLNECDLDIAMTDAIHGINAEAFDDCLEMNSLEKVASIDLNEDWDAEFPDNSGLHTPTPISKTIECEKVNEKQIPTLITMEMFQQFHTGSNLKHNSSSSETLASAITSDSIMDDEFEVSSDQKPLSLAKRLQVPIDMNDHLVLDEIPDLGLVSPPLSTQQSTAPSTSTHSPSKRYLASPSTSTATSIIVSECEDEGFDDILFPEFMDAESFNALKEKKKNAEYLEANNSKDNQGRKDEDVTFGIDIPKDFVFEPKRRVMSPSKIPRLAASTPVTPRASLGNPIASLFSVLNSATLQSSSRTFANILKPNPTRNHYGDGTELEGIDDLQDSNSIKSHATRSMSMHKSTPTIAYSVNSGKKQAEKRLSRPLGSSGRLWSKDEHTNSKLDNSLSRRVPSTNPAHQKKKLKQKPTLIRNLNQPESSKMVGGMVYNPKLQKWEGNDEMMLDFEKKLQVKPQSRPALITNISGCKTSQRVGEMIFDPVKMCWIGNEQEVVDVFGESDEPQVFASTKENKYLEFTLSKCVKESMCISEHSHKLFMGKWYPRAVTDSRTMFRDTSKTHLYEIRHVRLITSH